VISHQPATNPPLSAKDQETIEGMKKWAKIREKRRKDAGLPAEGAFFDRNALIHLTEWHRMTPRTTNGTRKPLVVPLVQCYCRAADRSSAVGR
jgi:hypothetical protein